MSQTINTSVGPAAGWTEHDEEEMWEDLLLDELLGEDAGTAQSPNCGHRWTPDEAAAAGRESGVCRWRKGLHHRLRDADPARLPEVLLAEAVAAEQRFAVIEGTAR